MASRLPHSTLFVLLLGLAGACSDEPQRIGKSESATSPASPHAMHPGTTPAAGTVHLAGRVLLAGSLAKAQNGAVFLIARSGGRTALVHKYDMSGPVWSTQGDERVLSFSLTDQDDMGGVGAPVGSKMELEARYDPDGFVDTKPGIEKKGAFKAFTSTSVGDTQISLKLDPAVPAPTPPPPTGDSHGIAPPNPHGTPPANPHGKPPGG